MKPVKFHVGNRRLLSLANLLRQVPREHFDFTNWVQDKAPKFEKDAPLKLSCGTAGCALGWATSVPALRRAGLKIKIFDEDGIGNGKIIGSDIAFHNGDDVYFGLNAGAAVFGIDFFESSSLFFSRGGERNVTPKQVAKKIETFVAKRIKDRNQVSKK